MTSTMGLSAIEAGGVAIARDVLDDKSVKALQDRVERLGDASPATRTRAGQMFARRNLLDESWARELAQCPPVFALVERVLGTLARPVRAILFDKTPEANWVVPWHQDLSIAVRERIDVPGFGPWSRKAGVVHVQPPVAILQRMLTIRLHLDDCGVADGPLRVIRGTHRKRLSPDDVRGVVESTESTVCSLFRGDALLMRPMILHSSLPATVPSRRRVIHIEYAAGRLPGGLAWYYEGQFGGAA